MNTLNIAAEKFEEWADAHMAKPVTIGKYKKAVWFDGVTKKTAYTDGFTEGMRYAFELFGKTEQLEKNPVVKKSLTTEITANGKRYRITKKGGMNDRH